MYVEEFFDDVERELLEGILINGGVSRGATEDLLSHIAGLRACGVACVRFEGKDPVVPYSFTDRGFLAAGVSVEEGVRIMTEETEAFCKVLATVWVDAQPTDWHCPTYLCKALALYNSR